MIATLSCDLCQAPLGTDVARLEVVRGRVSFLMRQQWRVDARPAGHRSLLICRPCVDYLDAALQHLRDANREQRRHARAA